MSPNKAVGSRCQRHPTRSATAATEACLDRIERFDPVLHAFITVTGKDALEAARAADVMTRDGRSLGSLHGVPIAVKDCIDVREIRCTAGSSFFADRIAVADAEVVVRLRAAGAVLIGKTNLHEFAYGGTTQNAFYGGCRNPWDIRRIPGGSSGGSAVAVAAGLAAGALGSDTGSSIRMPAALTGTTGLRPTVGSVSSAGILPVSPPHDVVGPIARSVAEVARIQSVIIDPRKASQHGVAPSDLLDQLEGDITGLRIAVPEDFFFSEAEPEVADIVLEAAKALERRGARLVSRSIPGASEAQSNLMPVLFADAADFHRKRLEINPGGFSIGVRKRLQPGLDMLAVDYAHRMRWIEDWQARCDAFFRDEADAMITPTVLIVAPDVGDDRELIEVSSQLSRFCWTWSAARIPALTVPCGFSAGLPVGMQIAARRWHDGLILNIGHAYQHVTDWHQMTPDLG